LVVAHQGLARARFPSLPFQHVLWQVLLYGALGPVLVWLILTWLTRRVRERDRAQAHLRCLYDVSRQAVTATEMEVLVEVALHMPGQILSSVATGLILRELPDGPWTLAGTYGLEEEERAALEAHLAAAGGDLRCGRCTAFAASVQQDCPLRSLLPYADMGPAAASVVCLSLSTEQPPLALLNVYLLEEEKLSPADRRALESGAAVLAVALDHARLRRRELQMLQHMEQAGYGRGDLAAALTRILADIARAHRAEAGQVFLVSLEGGDPALTPVAAWSAREEQPDLAAPAYQALQAGDSVVTTNGSRAGAHKVALPLMSESLTLGVLVLASRPPFTASQLTVLRATAGILALTIRNHQLYAQLESQAVLEERNRLAREVHDGLAQSLGFLNFKMQQVDRLLAREQWDAARQALGEMRAGVQDFYAEVRLTIQDLRWPAGAGPALVERLQQHVTDFTARTGLDVSLAIDGQPDLSPQAEVQLFRIVQEALANVRKHARAGRAWVRLRSGPEGITLEVEDDGVGLPTQAPPTPGGPGSVDLPEIAGHFGLDIIRERVEAIGGQLSLHSMPGQGTRLQVRLAPAPAADGVGYLSSTRPEDG